MNTKPIIIVSGEPYGVFNEIFLKVNKKKNFKKPIILIGSKKLLYQEAKKYKYKIDINLLDLVKLNLKKINNKKINLINVNFTLNKKKNLNIEIKRYIQKCFNIGINLIKNHDCSGLINGPINKKTFLNYQYPGITEYLALKFKSKTCAMLIYTKDLAVCPMTTHMPLKNVHKSITKVGIINKVQLINSFYNQKIGKKPKIAITGLNPHCESPDRLNEEKRIIIPAVNFLKRKKILIKGPFSADTIFLKDEIKKFDVIVGMYHDQVLAPLKALFNFDAINITLGLPFIRISPDHGPNQKMFGKNLSDPKSLLQAIKFLDN